MSLPLSPGFLTRGRGRLLIIAATVGTLLLAGVAAFPATASAAAPTVSNVTLTATTLTLTRQHKGIATVTFDVQASPALTTAPVVVDRSPAPLAGSVTATSTGGDMSNGSWTATVTFAAFMDGAHHLAVQLGSTRLPLGTVQVDGSLYPTLVGLRQEPRRLPAGSTTGAHAVGRVVQVGTTTPVKGIEVVVQRTGDAAGTVVTQTDGQGRFSVPWPWPRDGASLPRVSLQQQNLPGARFDRTPLPYPATRFRLATPRADKVTNVGTRLAVTGRVSPGHPLGRLGGVVLQERRGQRWVRLDRAPLVAGKHGHASYTLHTRLTKVGGHVLRVMKPGALCHHGCRIAEGHSPRIGVVAGNRVYFVEKKLAQLDVPVGTVDGQVDVRDQQAFCAWRDMAGMKPSRSALTPALVSSITSHDRLPAPDRPDGLYVSKTCQVLFQVVNHRFRRVVWASTGAPGYDTPNGTGAIFRKLRGPVESTLYPGAFMYDPMFFFADRPAIALHGSVSNDLVAPYPASHGCVRVWRPQIWHIWQESPIGTLVKVYGRY